MFSRILIANRGEIAVRVIRAAKELDVETVAIFHEVDKGMPFVHYADYAYQLHSDTPKNAYLDMNQIIEIAIKSGAEAIHPGYGFLSERSEFAQAIEDAGLAYIGPSASAIDSMGSKTKARELMSSAGVPIVPGTKKAITDFVELFSIAKEIGYPVLLKASAGGGGKGMRKVLSEDDLKSSFESAQREAAKAFGDDSVYIEKYIVNPKHIEIQVIADKHGNYAYLGERDCSIQRRHQKLIEEAPSNILDEITRQKMGEVAVNAAKACGYYNAGTVEFVMDRDKNFYFLEMNTRLQVEHPVTEMVTGIDLVKEQLRVASGEELSFRQEDVKLTGHAIECRIVAEDPFNSFMPDIGTINYMREPGGKGIRIDSGIETGCEITMHFDSMLAKLIVWGKDRADALNIMESALKNYKIKGIKTIIPFLVTIINHPQFQNGWFDTGFIDNVYEFRVLEQMKEAQEEVIAAISAYSFRKIKQNGGSSTGIPSQQQAQSNNWKKTRSYKGR
jgi:acetyl-CoA carboxylase biotin carboxylase subunit